MLQLIDVGTQYLDKYREIVGDDVVNELKELSRPIKGMRVLHLNATPYGGGVSELLRSVVPLLVDLGIDAEWKVIVGEEDFFKVTKWFHNALQGAKGDITKDQKDTYLKFSEKNARMLKDNYDVYMIHDPQPAALRSFFDVKEESWIWRCHIDTSRPNKSVWNFLRNYVELYDAFSFTMEEFVPGDLSKDKVIVIPPGIDPLSPKNINIPDQVANNILNWLGVDMNKPTITQVSRFDPWKDPIGVISSYRLIKKEIPEVCLNLVGSMALDDPEGWEIYAQIVEESENDPDLHVYTNFTGISNIEVNAFQRLSDVIIQKSIREGFGLVVSESLWKETPVVAGRAGGIPMQLYEAGYLVENIEETAEKVLHLLLNPKKARELGLKGKEHIRQNFLITRVLFDFLNLFKLVGSINK